MIEIPKSSTADTRTCDYTQVTKDTLYKSSQQHILDVQRALAFFGYLLKDAADRHDYDKLLEGTTATSAFDATPLAQRGRCSSRLSWNSIGPCVTW